MSFSDEEHVENLLLITNAYNDLCQKDDVVSSIGCIDERSSVELLRAEYHDNLSSTNRSRKVLKMIDMNIANERLFQKAKLQGFSNASAFLVHIQEKIAELDKESRKVAIDDVVQTDCLETMAIRWEEIEAKLDCALDESVEDFANDLCDSRGQNNYSEVLRDNELMKIAFDSLDSIAVDVYRKRTRIAEMKQKNAVAHRKQREMEKKIAELTAKIHALAPPSVSKWTDAWLKTALPSHNKK